jgi:hypothetical protein
MDAQKPEPDDVNALGGGEDTTSVTSLESNSSSPGVTPGGPTTPAPPPSPLHSDSLRRRIFGFITSLNIYMLLFILVLVIAGIGVYVVLQVGRRQAVKQTVESNQALSNETLDRLKNQDVSVGDVKQTLNIEANAIFAGRVLIRNGLDIAGPLKVGGSLSLAGLTVAGATTTDQLQTNGISVAGNAAVQGSLSVQKGLTVAGGGSFSGPVSAPQITTSSLQLNGDLLINRHITTSGGTPSLSFGGALGGGGTASISGTDTAGTVAINTGGSPSAGCFATITFKQSFGSTPHIALSPVGSGAGGISYYINRSSTNFSICAATAPPAGQSFAFDYVVMN